MKVNYEEIKNFCNATSSVVNNDKDELFCIQSDEATEILYRYVEDDENDPDSIVFTKDEDEAMEVFQELYDKLDEDSVLMYEENEYDEEDDVDADLLAKTLAFIKKKFKTKDKKKEDKKETEKEEVEASITVELNDFVDFYNEIKTLIEDDTILMDAKHVKDTPKESNLDKLFKAIEEELVEEDLDELSEKSLEFFKKCTGKVIVVEAKKKEEAKETKEEKKKEIEESKAEENPKKGRKKAEDKTDPKGEEIRNLKKAVEEAKAKMKDEIKAESFGAKDDVQELKAEMNSSPEHACCGKCQETKEEGILSSVKEPKSPLTITFAPVIDKGFVTFLQDILDAIKKYQGE